VALAAYAASGIAGGNTFKTGVLATGIAMGGFIIPYVFVFAPAMLIDIHNGVITGILAAMPIFLSALMGVFMMSACVTNFLKTRCLWYERLILLFGSIGLIIPGLKTDLTGLVCLALVFLLQSLRIKKGVVIS